MSKYPWTEMKNCDVSKCHYLARNSGSDPKKIKYLEKSSAFLVVQKCFVYLTRRPLPALNHEYLTTSRSRCAVSSFQFYWLPQSRFPQQRLSGILFLFTSCI